MTSWLDERVDAVKESSVAIVGGTFEPDPLLDMVDGDLDFVTQLIGTLEMAVRDSMIRLREAAATGDANGIRVAAHTLKGSVGHFGARDVVEHSMRLEMLGRDGDIETAAAELDELDGCVAALLAELATFVEGCRGRSKG
jgi:two-component system sensor histidine kinase/response regulator